MKAELKLTGFADTETLVYSMVRSYCTCSNKQMNAFATTVHCKSLLFLLPQVEYIQVPKHSFVGGTPSTLGNFNSRVILVTHHDSSHFSQQKTVFVLQLEKCCEEVMFDL